MLNICCLSLLAVNVDVVGVVVVAVAHVAHEQRVHDEVAEHGEDEPVCMFAYACVADVDINRRVDRHCWM